MYIDAMRNQIDICLVPNWNFQYYLHSANMLSTVLYYAFELLAQIEMGNLEIGALLLKLAKHVPPSNGNR